MNYFVSNTQVIDDIKYSMVVFYHNNDRMFCAVESSILNHSECLCGLNNTKIKENQENAEFLSKFEVLIGEEPDLDDEEYEEIEDLFDQD